MKLIFAAISILLVLPATAQTRTDVKLYGYVQPVTGGAHPSDVLTEDGKVLQGQGGERKNYFIYLTGPAGQRIYPMEIYINGEQFSTRSATITTTPVVLTIYTGETEPKKITAVPNTRGSVLMIQPVAGRPSKTLEAARQKATENEVVVSYRLAGKMYYATLKKLTVVEAAAMD